MNENITFSKVKYKVWPETSKIILDVGLTVEFDWNNQIAGKDEITELFLDENGNWHTLNGGFKNLIEAYLYYAIFTNQKLSYKDLKINNIDVPVECKESYNKFLELQSEEMKILEKEEIKKQIERLQLKLERIK